MSEWNSEQYIKFQTERTQPVEDLIAKLSITPKTVLDIGCGPGNSTERLKRHFKEADVLGVDASPNMLEKAKKTHPDLKFVYGHIPDDLQKFERFDLVFSNACLHWIPNHQTLFPAIMNKVNAGGVFAAQMPMVHTADFYRLLHRFLEQPRWKKLQHLCFFSDFTPEKTYDILSQISRKISVWETVYYHILDSHQAVLEWYKGSGLKPYLDALDIAEREVFLNELLSEVEKHFPLRADGSVILKMPRMFFQAYQ